MLNSCKTYSWFISNLNESMKQRPRLVTSLTFKQSNISTVKHSYPAYTNVQRTFRCCPALRFACKEAQRTNDTSFHDFSSFRRLDLLQRWCAADPLRALVHLRTDSLMSEQKGEKVSKLTHHNIYDVSTALRGVSVSLNNQRRKDSNNKELRSSGQENKK